MRACRWLRIRVPGARRWVGIRVLALSYPCEDVGAMGYVETGEKADFNNYPVMIKSV